MGENGWSSQKMEASGFLGPGAPNLTLRLLEFLAVDYNSPPSQRFPGTLGAPSPLAGGEFMAGASMRDIRGDLQDRAARVRQEIRAEQARFENLLLHVKTRRDMSLAQLRAQLHLANKLLEFTAWHDKVRASLAARIAVAEAAENLIRKSFEAAEGNAEAGFGVKGGEGLQHQ